MNILFATRPILGHILPTLGLAKRLIEYGHRVYFSGVPRFKKLISSSGAIFLPSSVHEMTFSDSDSFSSLSAEINAEFKGEETFLKETMQYMKQYEIQLIINDASIAGPSYAAEKLMVPWISLSLGAFIYKITNQHDPENNPIIRKFMLRSLNRIRSLHHLPKLKLESHFTITLQGLSPYLHLITSTQETQEELPATFCFVGPVHYQASPPLDPIHHKTYRHRILVTTPTYQNPQFYKSILRYLKTIRTCFLDKEVEVHISALPQFLNMLEPLPANFRFHNTYDFHPLPFESIDMVITHGGNSSFYRALTHGKPIILSPIGWDSDITADRCKKNHYGLVIRPDSLSIHSLYSAYCSILSHPLYSKNVNEKRVELQARDPNEVAARQIQRFITKKPGSFSQASN